MPGIGLASPSGWPASTCHLGRLNLSEEIYETTEVSGFERRQSSKPLSTVKRQAALRVVIGQPETS